MAGPGEIENNPVFFFRPIRDGYQFGLRVQGEWWKLHRQQLIPSLRDRAVNTESSVVLGFLPYGYFPEHVRRWNEPVSLWYGFDRKQRRWRQRLLQQGWALDEDDPTNIQ